MIKKTAFPIVQHFLLKFDIFFPSSCIHLLSNPVYLNIVIHYFMRLAFYNGIGTRKWYGESDMRQVSKTAPSVAYLLTKAACFFVLCLILLYVWDLSQSSAAAEKKSLRCRKTAKWGMKETAFRSKSNARRTSRSLEHKTADRKAQAGKREAKSCRGKKARKNWRKKRFIWRLTMGLQP